MRITPLDIYQQEFKRVLRGIDPDEVEDFLERIADDYEQLIGENTALKERIESLESQLAADGKTDQPHPSEKAVREDAGNIIKEARKEADTLIREAGREADNIIRKAKDEADKLRSAIQESHDVAADGETVAEPSEVVEKMKMAELELRREISRLRAGKERFLIEYRELLEKHLKLLTEDV